MCFVFSYENAITAFDDLANIVTKLEGFGLSKQDSKMLHKSVATAYAYIKNHFPFEIDWHSKVKSHCVKWALSEESNEFLRSDCDEEHDEDCSYCLSIPKIKYSLLGKVSLLGVKLY